MHEIRATVLPDCVEETARLAHEAGIPRVSVSEVFIHGSNLDRRIVSVETSTPRARAFVEAFLKSSAMAAADCTVTSREVRSIIDGESFENVTRPLSEPFTDIIQDLWQLSHVTASYLGRAASGALLLATGVIEDNPIAIVVAALFLPFLSQVLAVSFGAWTPDRKLALQGARAILVSILLAVAAGALVAWIEGGPVRYAGFRNPLTSLAISGIIGLTAGLSIADDTGRRYLIGVAAAVQFAVFPVWFGAVLVLGMPGHDILYPRLATFFINLVTISGAALVAYAALHYRHGRGWGAPHSNRRETP